jgi:hypothetical protein
VLENLLGTPPPPPPANAPPLASDGESKPRTMRQRMEAHRASPACAGCHSVMDPIGFAMENFDAVGAWRTRDGANPVDASGQLADGTRVNGVIGLRDALVKRSDVFYGTLTEKLLIYALGRGLQYYDRPVVRGIVRTASRDGHRFSAYILGVVTSTPFQMRSAAALPAPARNGGQVTSSR